ncbi:hypothetical protein IU433_06190 [Nocardia puris]|uniref:Secreted protein n=1 Tax=Nocardia puris TaxID=208602 RepID=A0A366DEL1_9NOCA|nr:hypothetical protein [Nocardia puris]MBF6211122.1 hypothetical protein [Nocardia puris]MBF6364841.1 hypothetical protein [Nocardia puris]MBF6458627.1 hypothetical protein [Nocardia puris]RBO87874.1 hypothetical protein DFR74_110129 [Nocardia puris]
MKFGSIAGLGIALAAAALSVAPAVATADDPEFPRNGVIPPGNYHIVRHPSNVVGSPLENCELRVHPNGVNTDLACFGGVHPGRQRPIGPDQTYVTFAFPLGFDLRDIDPRQGHWIGTVNIADTPASIPYPLAGVTLQRR